MVSVKMNTLILLDENAFPTICQKGINYFINLNNNQPEESHLI